MGEKFKQPLWLWFEKGILKLICLNILRSWIIWSIYKNNKIRGHFDTIVDGWLNTQGMVTNMPAHNHYTVIAQYWFPRCFHLNRFLNEVKRVFFPSIMENCSLLREKLFKWQQKLAGKTSLFFCSIFNLSHPFI